MLRFLLRSARAHAGARPHADRRDRGDGRYRVACARRPSALIVRDVGGAPRVLRSTVTAGVSALTRCGCGGEPRAADRAQAAAPETRSAGLERRKERIEDVNA